MTGVQTCALPISSVDTCGRTSTLLAAETEPLASMLILNGRCCARTSVTLTGGAEAAAPGADAAPGGPEAAPALPGAGARPVADAPSGACANEIDAAPTSISAAPAVDNLKEWRWRLNVMVKAVAMV